MSAIDKAKDKLRVAMGNAKQAAGPWGFGPSCPLALWAK